MTIETIAQLATLAVIFVGVVVWLIRLEGRVNTNSEIITKASNTLDAVQKELETHKNFDDDRFNKAQLENFNQHASLQRDFQVANSNMALKLSELSGTIGRIDEKLSNSVKWQEEIYQSLKERK